MQVQGKNLFPMEHYSQYMKGYFMDGVGELYSTKTGELKQLKGSTTPSGRYYTLNGQSYRADQLKRSAMVHSKFKAETSAPTAQVAPFTAAALLKTSDRQHAGTLAQGINGRGYVLALVAMVQGEEALIFGSKPKVHLTEVSADAEMARLATLKPGVKYVKLKILGGLVLGGLTRL